jgi:hypothetical protein
MFLYGWFYGKEGIADMLIISCGKLSGSQSIFTAVQSNNMFK